MSQATHVSCAGPARKETHVALFVCHDGTRLTAILKIRFVESAKPSPPHPHHWRGHADEQAYRAGTGAYADTPEDDPNEGGYDATDKRFCQKDYLAQHQNRHGVRRAPT